MPSDDLFSIYLKELPKYPPLSADRERELALSMQQGDKKAKDELINHNLRFAIKMASNYKNKGMEFEDLVCSANEGLCMAAERYTPAIFNARFQTYAGYWIRQTILKAFAILPTVRIPTKTFHYWKMLQKIKNIQRLTNEELANLLGCSPMTAKALRDINNFTFVSADSTDEESRQLLEVSDSFDLEEHTVLRCAEQDVRDAIDDLPEKEKDIIMRYRGIGCKQETSQEIGKSYNVSPERIRQIERKARVMVETRLRRKYSTDDFSAN